MNRDTLLLLVVAVASLATMTALWKLSRTVDSAAARLNLL